MHSADSFSVTPRQFLRFFPKVREGAPPSDREARPSSVEKAPLFKRRYSFHAAATAFATAGATRSSNMVGMMLVSDSSPGGTIPAIA